jgi:AcrR family transcriptional regulator
MRADKRSPKRPTKAPAAERPRDDRTRKRTALRRSATDVYRRAILDAAERVFSGGSFADAKMAAIAKEAGLAAGTLYNYFASKEQIFESLVELRGQELLEEIEAVAARGLQPLPRLSATVGACLGYTERHREMFRIFLHSPMIELAIEGGASEAAARIDRRAMRLLEDAVGWAAETGVLRRDVPPAELAVFLGGVIQAFIRAWLVHDRGRGSIAVKAATIVDLFIAGAGAAR